jgi:CelD/BcsL family acetyltransferase involved in cellulose biosynthesis
MRGNRTGRQGTLNVHGTLHQQVEWRSLAGLTSIAAEWASLAQRALEPNVFYEPAFALAAAPAFGMGVGAGLVWSRSVPRRLIGFFPARIERFRYGLPLSILIGWTHPYAPLGTPLVDRVAAEGVISTWFSHIAGNAQLPKLVLLPYLPTEGPLATALARQLSRPAIAFFDRHARALLAPAGDRSLYLDQAVHGKKRKELRRQRNRLAEMGHLVSAADSSPSSISVALEDFLALEAAGWKGRARSAARCREEIADFVARAVNVLAQERKAEVVRLCLDGRAIAALVLLRSGDTGWCWKITYDEAYARFSPGVQVLLDTTERLLADERVRCVDSCATTDHPMIDHVWRERLHLADCLFAVIPAAARAFALASVCEAARRTLVGGGKRLLKFASSSRN